MKKELSIRAKLIVDQIIKESVIKRCPKKNLSKDHPVSEQQWCLFDSKGEKLLGRHKTKQEAKDQERAVQFFKHRGK